MKKALQTGKARLTHPGFERRRNSEGRCMHFWPSLHLCYWHGEHTMLIRLGPWKCFLRLIPPPPPTPKIIYTWNCYPLVDGHIHLFAWNQHLGFVHFKRKRWHKNQESQERNKTNDEDKTRTYSALAILLMSFSPSSKKCETTSKTKCGLLSSSSFRSWVNWSSTIPCS